MKYKPLIMTAGMLSVFSGTADAANIAVITQVPVILNIVILAAAVACLAVAIKLFNLVKGGALAKGWQLWIISFFALAFGQVFVLAEKLEVFAIGFDIVGLFYLVTVVMWFLGLLQTRKVMG